MLPPRERDRYRDVQEQIGNAVTGTVERPCPVCPNSNGTLGKSPCPACQKSGKVRVAAGDRLALTFMVVRSEHDREVVGHGDGKLRSYNIVITPPALQAADLTNLPEPAVRTLQAHRRSVEAKIWAHSTERAMILARDAAIWDGVPRPFTVTVSRSFIVEDEVIQKTRDTTGGDG